MGEMSVLVGPSPSKSFQELFPPGTVVTPGDTKIMWDSTKPDEVEAAKSTFDKLVAKGYIAFRAEGRSGEKGEKIKTWDPNAERLILVPKIQGGLG